jgi:hypothetical protein
MSFVPIQDLRSGENLIQVSTKPAAGQLRPHLQDFVAAYNCGRRLKRLPGLTPYGFICKPWAAEPLRFNANPHHQMLGPNT